MKQGEIWLLNLDPAMGAEIKKTRPCLIINDDSLGKLPLKIIVPVTDWNNRYEAAPWFVKIEMNGENGLLKTSGIDCFQIRSVSEKRFVRKIGKITHAQHEEIKEALAKVLSF